MQFISLSNHKKPKPLSNVRVVTDFNECCRFVLRMLPKESGYTIEDLKRMSPDELWRLYESTWKKQKTV